MDKILDIKNLKYTYPDETKALNGINLTVNKGEKVAVLGSNGSGKSTLFLCLNGVLKATDGEILFGSKKVEYDKKSLIELRKNVGIVFQDPETQLFCVDVYQEVAFAPQNLCYDEKELDKCVEENLKNVDISHLRDKPPHFLSYGQKKRVSIASVLSIKPQVIIFDEPTSALDPEHAKQIISLMDKLNKEGLTIIMSTHDVDIAYYWADKIVVLKDGGVFKVGTSKEVFTDCNIVKQCDLQMPVVLKIFFKLQEVGIINRNTPLPNSYKQLEEILDRIKKD